MNDQKLSLPVNRQYKARIFEMLYQDKKELLNLYNAVNGTAYQDPELLEINTLENAIYMGMHNDVSFVIGCVVSLYEHQSTFSPNLPLRFLLYMSDLYSRITKDANLYGEKQVKIPTPKFLIFYNGIAKRPERAITECIREGILAEFLSAHRSEAKKVSIYEYDEEKHMRMEREESYAEGVKQGIEQGIKEGVQQGIKEGVQQEKLQTIRKMLLDGLPTEKIKQYTDAADEEITKAKSGL